LGALIGSAQTVGATVAVLYPDVREPYFSVFQAILEGIDARVQSTVKHRPLPEDFDPEALRHWLLAEGVDVVIALGQRGMRAATAVDTKVPVYTGAVLSPPRSNGHAVSGISLAADPKRIFATLKSLAPEVKRVFVVYNPDDNAWLMNLARPIARSAGLELRGYEAQDLRDAVRHYKSILDEAKGPEDVLWLPLDGTTVDDRVVLPIVLEAAWDHQLVVFSSNPEHVQRGVLFALYPDNFALGHRLGELALRGATGTGQEAGGILPLEDLLLAVNLRTAGHLRLRLSATQRREFDLVFPAR
jgi:putative ABC transport system substrate-binding protein